MKSFKQYRKDIAPYFHIPKNKSMKGYPGSNTDNPPSALIDAQRHLDEPVSMPQTDTNMYSEQEEMPYQQWINQQDNDERIRDISRRLHKEQKTTIPDMDNEDHDELHGYTEGSHINRRLFKAHVSGNPEKSKLPLDSVLDKHKLTKDMHVYSGVQFDPGYVASQHDERHIHLPAYTSTTVDKPTAADFAGKYSESGNDDYTDHHIIHFHLKKGQKGAYVGEHPDNKDSQQLSRYPFEQEYILPRNTKIKVGEKPDVYHSKIEKKKYHVWHAHVADSESEQE